MTSGSRGAAIVEVEPADDAVEAIFRHCRGVVAASRAIRAHSYALHERYSRTVGAVVLTRRRLGYPLPRLMPPRSLHGGAGSLNGRRVVLLTDDPDTRALVGPAVTWCGATIAAVSSIDLVAYVNQVRRLITTLDGHGRRPYLVALTKHRHDHPDREARHAGFDLQIDEPVDPHVLEVLLAGLVRQSA